MGTPSYVAFTDSERLIGDAAKNQVALNPTNTIFDAKRLIGRKYNDDTVQKDKKLWPFQVINDNTKPKVEVEYQYEKKYFLPKKFLNGTNKNEGNSGSLFRAIRKRCRGN